MPVFRVANLIFVLFLFLECQVFGFEKIQWALESSLSVPQPVQVGVEVSCQGKEFFCNSQTRFYLDGGYFRYPILSEGTGSFKGLQLYSVEIGSRVRPFVSRGFYLSSGVGFRQIAAKAGDVSAFKIGDDVAVSSARLDLSTFYFSPSLGWLFQVSERAQIGLDVGVQISLKASGNLFLSDDATGRNSNNSNDLRTNSETALGRVAGLVIPKVTLFRFVWNL